MPKSNKEKTPMNKYQTIQGTSIEFETIPPEKGKTEAQRPKVLLELLQEGEEYISIKAEGRENER